MYWGIITCIKISPKETSFSVVAPFLLLSIWDYTSTPLCCGDGLLVICPSKPPFSYAISPNLSNNPQLCTLRGFMRIDSTDARFLVPLLNTMGWIVCRMHIGTVFIGRHITMKCYPGLVDAFAVESDAWGWRINGLPCLVRKVLYFVLRLTNAPIVGNTCRGSRILIENTRLFFNPK